MRTATVLVLTAIILAGSIAIATLFSGCATALVFNDPKTGEDCPRHNWFQCLEEPK